MVVFVMALLYIKDHLQWYRIPINDMTQLRGTLQPPMDAIISHRGQMTGSMRHPPFLNAFLPIRHTFTLLLFNKMLY